MMRDERMRQWLRTWLIDRGGLVTLLVLVVYIWIAPTHVVNGDNAEFSTLGTTGGAAHPPGYPAYLMWLRLWSWLPAQSPAHAAAISTCILSALQTFVLHAACRAWGARPTAAAFVVGMYAMGPIVLRVQSEAEVFAPHSLICALVLWLSALSGPLRGIARAFALGLVAGLGMSNQLTCVLLAPIGLLGAIRGIRESKRVAITIVAAMLGLVAGLSSYLYLLVTPDTLASWGKLHDLHDLWWHFLRMDYGGPGSFAPRGIHVPMMDNLIALGRTTGRSYVWVPAVLAVGSLVWFTVRPKGESRVAWIVLAASWFVCGPLLVSRFDVGLDDIGIYIVQRFHLMSVLVLAIPLAVAIDRIVMRIENEQLRSRAGVVAIGLPIVVVLSMTSLSLSYVVRFHSAAIERNAENLLRTLPPNAVVLGAPDVYTFVMAYEQGALGLRPDVVVITTPQLRLGFHRRRIEERTGVRIESALGQTMNVPLTEKLLATGRPVFVDQFQFSIVKAFPTYPYGTLYRVLPRGTLTPSVDEVYAMNVELYDKFVFDYMLPGMHDENATRVHFVYANVWRVLANSLRAAGANEKAADALERAEALEPDKTR
jgi:hypothetical protein